MRFFEMKVQRYAHGTAYLQNRDHAPKKAQEDIVL